MDSKTYDRILSIILEKKYDIEALHEIGLPRNFSQDTGLDELIFEPFYREYTKRKNEPIGQNIPEQKEESHVEEVRPQRMYDGLDFGTDFNREMEQINARIRRSNRTFILNGYNTSSINPTRLTSSDLLNAYWGVWGASTATSTSSDIANSTSTEGVSTITSSSI